LGLKKEEINEEEKPVGQAKQFCPLPLLCSRSGSAVFIVKKNKSTRGKHFMASSLSAIGGYFSR